MLIILIAVLCISACNSSTESETINLTVIEIEKYGHAILDITAEEFSKKGYDLGDFICVRFEEQNYNMPYYDGYYSYPLEYMLRGLAPEENIAVCINYGNITEKLGISVGDTVEITMVEKAAMLDIQEVSSIHYSNDVNDYPDEITFANFRAVTLGNIGEGKLYRTASPINNIYNRAQYANRLIEEAGVATVLNLADSEELIESFFEEDGFESFYYKNLYESGNVIAMDMAANFFTDDFAAKIAEGFTFLAQNEPPYAVHCNEGKDRAGFAVMLLEGLMGADYYEITDDYTLSFNNYYGITEENNPEKYEAIVNVNLYPILMHITEVDDKSKLPQVDYEKAMTKYLLDAGMTAEDIDTLKEKLS